MSINIFHVLTRGPLIWDSCDIYLSSISKNKKDLTPFCHCGDEISWRKTPSTTKVDFQNFQKIWVGWWPQNAPPPRRNRVRKIKFFSIKGLTPLCNGQYEISWRKTTSMDPTKGQLISKADSKLSIWTKKPTKIFLYFCPSL